MSNSHEDIMPQISKAVTLMVDFGFTTIEGLMMPNGDYAVSVPQVAALVGTSRKTASRDFKRLMGEGFRVSKVATDQGNQRINAMPLDVFTDLLYFLAKQGNPIADSMARAFLHETPQRRFDTAAGKKVEESEYNKRLAQRMERVTARFEWTDAVMSRGLEKTGHKPGRGTYRDLTVKVNRVLFNRDHFYCDRDNMTPNQQRTITAFETMVANFANLFPDDSPDQLIERALVAWNGGRSVKSLK
jgi:hypothetical protein